MPASKTRAWISPSWPAPRLRRRRGASPSHFSPVPASSYPGETSGPVLPAPIVTVSKNANVATGGQGERDAARAGRAGGGAVGSEPGDVLVGSTGVIGPPLPDGAPQGTPRLGQEQGWTVRVCRFRLRGPGHHDHRHRAKAGQRPGRRRPWSLVIAKGSGMIEPDMATLLGYVFTDAAVPGQEHGRPPSGGTVEATFNSLSIDTDTSTSDTVLVLANGAGGARTGGGVRARFAGRVPFADLAAGRRRRGRDQGDPGDRRRGSGRRPGKAGGQGSRQLAAGEVRRARRRPQLGPGRHGDRQMLRRHRHRPGRGAGELRRLRGLPPPASTSKASGNWPS